MSRNGRALVKPAELAVSVAVVDSPKRRKNGVVCTCGSDDVEITHTISRSYPAVIAGKMTRKKQRCCCRRCRRVWMRRVEVTEREL